MQCMCPHYMHVSTLHALVLMQLETFSMHLHDIGKTKKVHTADILIRVMHAVIEV